MKESNLEKKIKVEKGLADSCLTKDMSDTTSCQLTLDLVRLVHNPGLFKVLNLINRN